MRPKLKRVYQLQQSWQHVPHTKNGSSERPVTQVVNVPSDRWGQLINCSFNRAVHVWLVWNSRCSNCCWKHFEYGRWNLLQIIRCSCRCDRLLLTCIHRSTTSIERHLKSFFTKLHARHATRSSHDKAVRPSVRLPNAWFVTKWKKILPTFLYHQKDHLS